MKFFIDTANVDQIQKAKEYGLLDGVTTNPTLFSKENEDWKSIAQKICEIVEGPVNLEVVSTDSEGMVKEGRDLITYGPNVVVKIPMTMEGMKAVRILSEEDIPTNVTLVFSAVQALLAAKAGAHYVSPFVGRLDAIGTSGMELVSEVITIFDTYAYDTEVIVASIRHPAHVLESALMGADIATVPFDVITKLSKHPLTDTGLDSFLKDWETVKK